MDRKEWQRRTPDLNRQLEKKRDGGKLTLAMTSGLPQIELELSAVKGATQVRIYGLIAALQWSRRNN